MASKGANNWFKNVAKSIGYIAQDTVSDQLSSTIDFFTSNAEIIREDIGEAKNVKDYVKIKTSFADDYIKAGKNAIKYAKEDIKSGKIYNKERIEKNALDDMDDGGFFDDFEDFDFDDEDLDIDIDDDGNTKEVKIEKTLNVNKFEANISEKSPLVKSVRGTTDAIYQTAEASNKLTATLFESTINTMGSMGASLSEGLNVVNTNLGSIVSFQNGAMSTFIESSNRYYEESLKLMAAQIDEVRKLTTIQMEEMKQGNNPTDVFLSSGGLDLLSYKNLVGRQLEAIIDETPGLSNFKSFLSDKSNLESAISSPIKFVAESVVQTVIPTVVKESMESFDKTFSEFFPALLSKVAGFRESDNPLLSLFGKIFGVDPQRKTTVNLGNYERGAVPFDGYVRKSIVEVIPGYLRKIEAALTGGNERGFDFTTGTFRDAYDMKSDFANELRKEVLASFNDVRYDLYDKARKIRSKDGTDLQLTDKIDRLLEIIGSSPEIRGITTNEKGSPGFTKLSKVLSEYNFKGDEKFSEEDIEIMTALYNTLSKSQKAGLNGRMRFDAASRKKRFLEEAELNPYESNANYAYGNLEIDKGRTDKSINWKNKGLVDRWGNGQLDYLRDIKEILLTGIKVFPTTSFGNNITGNNTTPTGPSLLSGYSYDDVLQHMREERDSSYRTYDFSRPLDSEREKELKGDGYWIYDPNEHISAKEIQRKIDEAKDSAGVTDNTSTLTDAANSLINGKFSGQKEKLKSAQETYNNTLASIQSIFEVPSRMIKGVFDKLDNTLYKILFGSEDDEEQDNSFLSKTFNLMRQKVTDFTDYLKEKLFGEEGLFSQVKKSDLYQKLAGKGKDFAESLLGEQDENGIRSGGILSETANELSDTFRGAASYFTGKEWVDSKGVKHDKQIDAVFPVVASTFNSLKDNLKGYLFGEDDELDENGEKKGVITSALDHLSGGFDILSEALFGPKFYEGKDGKKYKNRFSSEMEGFNEKLRERAPKAIAWGTIGGAAGLLGGITNVGLLGSLFLPGGPVGMALIGGVSGWLAQSDKFKNWLFGEKDPDGERLGGLISAKTQKFFKENKTPIIGGATLGAIKGVVGGGFLTSMLLPGGPIGGALLGMGASMITRSDMFQDMLYGPKDAEGLRKSGKGVLGSLFGKKKEGKLDKKTAGAIGAGAISGAALSAVISKFGLMGAALTPLGPLGGALAGAAVGLIAASDKWKEKVFGKLNEETGEREGGLMGQFQNWAKLNIFAPMKLGIENMNFKVKEWFMEGISLPLQNAIDPLKQGLIAFGTKISDTFKTVTETLVTKVSDMFKTFSKSLLGKLVTNVGKLLFGVVKKSATLPFRLAGKVASAPFKLLEKAAMHKVKKDKKNGLKYEWRAKTDEDGNEVTDEEGNTIYEKHRRSIGTRARAIFDRDYRKELQATGGQVYDRDGNLVAGEYISDWEYNRKKRQDEWTAKKQGIQSEIARKRVITDLIRNKNIDSNFIQKGDSESQNATDALFDILNMDKDQLEENFGGLINLKFNRKGKLKLGKLSDTDKQKILDRAQEMGHEKYMSKVEAQKENYVKELPTVVEQTKEEVTAIKGEATGTHQQLTVIREYFAQKVNPIMDTLKEKVSSTTDNIETTSTEISYMRNDVSKIVSLLERRFNIKAGESTAPSVKRRYRARRTRRMTNRGLPGSTEEAAPSEDDIIDLGPDDYRELDGGEGGFGVPYYSQMDSRWAGKNYNRFGKFGLTGCGPTAMAMIAGGFGANASPYDMAKIANKGKFNDSTGTNWKFVGPAAKAAGLKTKQQLKPSRSFINGQLSKGKPVLLSGRGGYGTPYTSAGHYVVATGKDEYGNPIINDPRGREYSGVYDINSTLKSTRSAWSFDKGSGSSLTQKGGGGFGDIEDDELLNKENLVDGMSEALDDSELIKKTDTIKVKIVSSDIPIGGVSGGTSVFSSDGSSASGSSTSGPFASYDDLQFNMGNQTNPFSKTNNRPVGTIGGLFKGLGTIGRGLGSLVNSGVSLFTGGKSNSLGSLIGSKLSSVPILGAGMKVGSGLLNAGKSAFNGLSNFFNNSSSNSNSQSTSSTQSIEQPVVTAGSFTDSNLADTREELLNKGTVAGNPNIAAQSRILKGVSLSAQGGSTKGWNGIKGESEYTNSVSREDRAHYIKEKFNRGLHPFSNTVNTQNNQYIYGSDSSSNSVTTNPLSSILNLLKKGLPVIAIPAIGKAALNALTKLGIGNTIKEIAKKANEAISSLFNKLTNSANTNLIETISDTSDTTVDDTLPIGIPSKTTAAISGENITGVLPLNTVSSLENKQLQVLRDTAKKYGIPYTNSTTYATLYATIVEKEKQLGILGTSKSSIKSIPAPATLAIEEKTSASTILDQIKAKQAEKVPVGATTSSVKNTAKASLHLTDDQLSSYRTRLETLGDNIAASELEHDQTSAKYQNNSYSQFTKKELVSTTNKLRRIAKNNAKYGAKFDPALSIEENATNINKALENKYATSGVSIADDVIDVTDDVITERQLPSTVNNNPYSNGTTANNAFTGTVEGTPVDKNYGRKLALEDPETGVNYRGIYKVLSHVKNGSSIVTNGLTINDNQLNPFKGIGAVGLNPNYDRTGILYSKTTSATKALSQKGTKMLAETGANLAETGSNKLVRGAGTALRTAGNVGTNVIEKGSKVTKVIKAADDAVGRGIGKGINAVIGGVKKVGSKVGKKVSEKSTNSGIVGKFIKLIKDTFTKWLSNSKLVKFLGKGVSKLAKWIQTNIFGKLTEKIVMPFATKISAALAKVASVTGVEAATLGIGAGVFAVYDGFTGALDAANLFQVSGDDVTIPMRTISSLLKILVGLGNIGPILDVLVEIISSISGFNIKTELASKMYEIYCNIFDEEAGVAFKEAQVNFDNEYKSFVEETGVNVSKDSYNDVVNQTSGSKIWSGVKSIGKGIGSLWSSSEEEHYTDANGNKYYENEDGTYTVYNSNGKKYGKTDALPENVTRVEATTKDGILKKGVNAVKKGIGSAGKAIAGFAGTAKDKVVGGAKSAGKAISGFFGSAKDTTIEGVTALASAVSGVSTTFMESAKNSIVSAIKGEDKEPVELDANDPLLMPKKIAAIGGRVLLTPVTAVISLAKGLYGGVKDLFESVKKIGSFMGGVAKDSFSNAIDGVLPSPTLDTSDPMGTLKFIAEAGINTLLSPITLPITAGVNLIKSVKPVATAVANAGKFIGSTAVNAVSNAISGKDLIEVETEEGALGNIQKIASIGINTLLTPITLPIRAGKAIFNKAKDLFESVKKIGSFMGGVAKTAFSNAIDGVLPSPTLDTSDPMGTLKFIAEAGINTLLSPITLPITGGVKLLDGVKQAWNATSGVRSFIGDAAGKAFSSAIKGEVAKATLDTEDSMGALKFAAEVGIQTLLSPITLPIAGGVKLLDGVKALWEGIKGIGSFVGEVGSASFKAAKNGEDYTYEGDEEDSLNSIKTVAAGGIDFLMNLIRVPVKIGKFAADSFDDFTASFKKFGSKISEYAKYPGKDATFEEFMNMGKIDEGILGSLETVAFKGIRSFMILRWVFDQSVGAIGDVFKGIGDWAGEIKDTIGEKANWLLDKIGLGSDYVVTGGNGEGGFGSGGFLNNHSYFSQNDPRWRNVKYNSINNDKRTISESGCGPASMAMVVNDMTGKNTDPVTMAKLAKEKGYNDETGTNWDFVSSAANEYGLTANQSKNPSSSFVDSQLSKGKPVLLSGRGGLGTPYTTAGHYVVAVGKDSKGNYIINDPRGKGYSGKYSAEKVLGSTGSAWSFNGGGNGGKVVRVAKGKLGPFRMQGGGFGSVVTVTSVNKSASDSEKQAAVVAAMKSLEGKLNYTQSSKRTEIEEGYGDCSSTIWWIYKNVLGLSIGTTSSGMASDGKGAWVDKGAHPNEANLQPGDVLIFSGHVEMYVGNGQTMGHGGGSDGKTKGPVYHSLSAYNNRTYVGAKRYIGDATNIVGSIGGTATSSDSSGNDISSALSAVGNSMTDAVFKAWGFSSNPFQSSSTDSTTTTDGTTTLSGNSNAEQVWNYLRGKGMTPEATAAIMGNFQQESGLNPRNLQGTYENSLGMTDDSYTSGVDNGSYSNFASDSAGYGLAQWTYSSRKKNLYDYIKSKNLSIGDLGGQLDYFWKEFSSYKTLMNQLNSSTDVSSNTSLFERVFERAGTPNMPARQKYANQFYSQFGGNGGFGSGYPLDELEKYDTSISQNTDDITDTNFTYVPTAYYTEGGYGKKSATTMKSKSKTLTSYLSSSSNDNKVASTKVTKNSTDDKIDKILYYLEVIAENSGDSNSNLSDIKKKISNLKNSVNNTTNNSTRIITSGKGATSSNNKSSKSDKPTSSSFYTKAKSISKGRTQ